MDNFYEYNNFNQLIKIFNNSTIIFEKDFQQYIQIIEDIIVYSFNVHQIITKELIDRNIEIDGIISQTIPLYFRNCHYLFSSYLLLRKGLVDPSGALSRVIFETITHIYIYQLTDYEANLLYKQDTNNLTDEEFLEVKKAYNFFNPSKIREILYIDDLKDEIKNFYQEICKPAHPSTWGFLSNIEYKPQVIENSLKLLLALAFSSIVAIFEVFHQLVSSDELNKLDEKLTLISKTIKNIPLLVPNHPNLKDSIKVNPTFVKTNENFI